jgi:hypothetical protein
MPYVTCPSCHKIGYTPPTRHAPDLCSRCGAVLPLRRSVVPISRVRQGGVEPQREPALRAA